ADHFSENAASFGPALRPLLAFIDRKEIAPETLSQIEARLGGGSATLDLDFKSYIADQSSTAPDTPPGKEPPQFVKPSPAGAKGTSAPADPNAPLRLVFFHNPGCHECEEARNDLHALKDQFPNLAIEEHNIRETAAVLLNETLCSRFSVESTLRQVTPAVFMQAGALIKDDIDRPALHELIARTRQSGDSGDWLETADTDIEAAQKTVDERFATFGIVGVFLAGLLDGVNPCAFATIIFLLSYLQVTRRNSREILAVGGAFIVAVFLTYFALGLGLVEVVGRLTTFRAMGRALNLLLAVACLWVAWMSFRDARLARQGRLADMSLQLPGFLKDRIRSVIRTGSRSPRFVVAAFLSGIVISLLELACTGQVYLPTIIYAMKTGADKAVWFLLLYNIAF
ncbi:MAG: hypothetical protein KDM63_21315, partial [Verrucomicrobiae bacterium]|nr:hypothetical protein [Verrucomicrobiae bacterium]